MATLATVLTTTVAALTVAALATAIATTVASVATTETTAAEATATTAASALSGLVNADLTTIEPRKEIVVSRCFQQGERDRSRRVGIGGTRDARLGPARLYPSLKIKGNDGSSCLLLVVHSVHSGSSLLVGGVADETETAAAAGITVLDNGLGKKIGVLEGCDQL